MELFVWYRCEPGAAEAVAAAARALLARVEHECGIAGRLLLRAGTEPTWMEHYVAADAAALARLRASLAAGWAPGLPVRHEECFEPLSPAPLAGTDAAIGREA